MPTESKTSARRISARKKQAQALELRKGGATFAQIAQHLGFRTASGAHYAVMESLNRITSPAAEEYRTLNTERLNSILLGLWPQVRRGDPVAANSAIRAINELNRMHGLHAPTVIEVNWRQQLEMLATIEGLQGDQRESVISEALAVIEGAR
jgi:hypothetical protein